MSEHKRHKLSDDIVTSDQAQGKRRWSALAKGRRFWLVLGTFVVLFGLGVVGYIVFHKTTEPIKLPANIDTDIENTPESNLALLLEYNYGITQKDLDSDDITPKLTNFDMAHDVGVVYYRQGEISKAISAYGKAATFKDAPTGHLFYIEYCRMAYQAQRYEFGDEQCDKAISLIKNNLPDGAEKRNLVVSIENMKKARGQN